MKILRIEIQGLPLFKWIWSLIRMVENLANILKRNDIKKSEAYQSGFLEGTTPMYEAYMRLKKNIANSIKGDCDGIS